MPEKIFKKYHCQKLFEVDRFYVFPFYFADISLTRSIKNVIGGKVSRVLVEFNQDHADYYISIKEVNKLGKNLFKRILNDQQFYKKVEDKILKYGEKLMNFCQKINKIKIAKLNNHQLYNLYHQYGRLIIQMRDWGWVPVVLDGLKVPYLSNYLIKQLNKFLKKGGYSQREIASYYSLLTSSEKMSEVAIEEWTRLNLIRQLVERYSRLKKIFKEKDEDKIKLLLKRSYPAIYKKFKKHAKDFGWLTFYYIGPPMKIKDVIKAVKNDFISNQSISWQIEKMEKYFSQLANKKRQIIKKLHLPGKLVYLLNVSSFFTYLKDQRKGTYQKSYVAMEPVMKEIAKRLKLSIKEVKYLVDEEIMQALLKRKNFSNITKRRIEYCVSYVHSGKVNVLIDDRATRLINKLVSQTAVQEKTDIIKGTVAYAGKVKGIVKLVITKEDVDKVKKGDILVSPATNPDLIIAMKKSAAFVTDRGGITSHAAIVSRELKKPCVVGTGIATKVLKDGDLVEVDAVNGVVKKLVR